MRSALAKDRQARHITLRPSTSPRNESLRPSVISRTRHVNGLPGIRIGRVRFRTADHQSPAMKWPEFRPRPEGRSRPARTRAADRRERPARRDRSRADREARIGGRGGTLRRALIRPGQGDDGGSSQNIHDSPGRPTHLSERQFDATRTPGDGRAPTAPIGRDSRPGRAEKHPRRRPRP